MRRIKQVNQSCIELPLDVFNDLDDGRQGPAPGAEEYGELLQGCEVLPGSIYSLEFFFAQVFS